VEKWFGGKRVKKVLREPMRSGDIPMPMRILPDNATENDSAVAKKKSAQCAV